MVAAPMEAKQVSNTPVAKAFKEAALRKKDEVEEEAEEETEAPMKRLRPCFECAKEGMDVESHYKGPDNENLCARHADGKGTKRCKRPCVEYAKEGKDVQSNYKGPAGDNLCAPHADGKGTKRCKKPCKKALLGVDAKVCSSVS